MNRHIFSGIIINRVVAQSRVRFVNHGDTEFTENRFFKNVSPWTPCLRGWRTASLLCNNFIEERTKESRAQILNKKFSLNFRAMSREFYVSASPLRCFKGTARFAVFIKIFLVSFLTRTRNVIHYRNDRIFLPCNQTSNVSRTFEIWLLRIY